MSVLLLGAQIVGVNSSIYVERDRKIHDATYTIKISFQFARNLMESILDRLNFIQSCKNHGITLNILSFLARETIYKHILYHEIRWS